MDLNKINSKATLIIVAVLLFISLPFHYVFYDGSITVFTKDHFTFSKTIITTSDIDNYIKEYNEGNLFEKNSIMNDPLIKKLREEYIITNKESNE